MYAGDPTITDWLQGLGTVSGTVFAAIAAVIAFRVLRHDQRVRHIDETDAIARQARSVLVVFENPAPAPNGTMQTIPVVLHNFSPGVIMEVRFAARRRDGERGGFAISMDFLAPKGDYSRDWNVESASLPNEVDPTTAFETYVAFTDSHGLRWMRINRDQPAPIQVGTEIDHKLWAQHHESAG